MKNACGKTSVRLAINKACVDVLNRAGTSGGNYW
jgi:hypothetical protein